MPCINREKEKQYKAERIDTKTSQRKWHYNEKEQQYNKALAIMAGVPII